MTGMSFRQQLVFDDLQQGPSPVVPDEWIRLTTTDEMHGILDAWNADLEVSA